jgi:hypothetical protein
MLSCINFLSFNRISKALIVCLYNDVFIFHVVCIAVTLHLFKLWSLLTGRIWLGNNWRVNMDARNCGEEPGVKTKGGTEGHQNSRGMILFGIPGR